MTVVYNHNESNKSFVLPCRYHFPSKVRELLKILSVLPIGSVEAERSFSCKRYLQLALKYDVNRETG
ncbi:hypothetical protein HOLleu_39055 [Holothuria leucospilota]|uniref:Uncharacterized protein n=1 Tax=Holothuria leucospilota TaxID=206669 RepID=A0A9Q0YFL7_HOLLE|nr:hypothetical protein HOLleu_39055 [Holothuria leucospilota]